MRWRYSWLAGLLGAALFTSFVSAQDEKPAEEKPVAEKPAEEKPAAEKPAEEKKEEPAASPAAKKFNEVKATWDKNSAFIEGIVKKYRAANEEEREKLRKEYEGLVKQSESVYGELRTAAVEAYKEAPNKNKNVTNSLIGMLDEEIRTDRYETALEIAKLLIDNKAEDKTICNLAGQAAYSVDDFDNAHAWLKEAEAAGKIDQNGEQYLDDAPDAKKRWAKELAARKAEAAKDDLPRVKLKTSKGDVMIELFENEAPEAVGNFVSLVEKGFYDGLSFHRVLGNFMAQGGDPEGTGGGGPGYKIFCECEKPEHRNHFRGTLSMAHAGKNTGGSQFFLTFRPTMHLDGKHTAFGRVVEGMDVLAKLQRRDPNSPSPPTADKIVKAEVVRKRDHEYKPHKVE